MGEEGENGWNGRNFQPAQCNLAEVMGARQGRFFLRVYDEQGAMLDGAQFRYLRDLREIQVNGEPYSHDTLLVPSAAGYPPTAVRFMGVDGSPIHASPLPGTAAVVDEMGGLIAALCPEADEVACTLSGDGGGVDIVLRLPRIWWRMERDEGDGEWCSTPLMMTRRDFRKYADASAVLRLRSPKRISSVFVGFGDEPDINYLRKDGGFELPLANFVDHVEIDHRLAEDARFNVRFDQSNDRRGQTVLTLVQIAADPDTTQDVQTGSPPLLQPDREMIVTTGQETRPARVTKAQGTSRSTRIFTPDEVAKYNQSKYLGVLVAARYARELNMLPMKDHLSDQTKPTTRALQAIVSGRIEYRLVRPTTASTAALNETDG